MSRRLVLAVALAAGVLHAPSPAGAQVPPPAGDLDPRIQNRVRPMP